MGKHSDWLEQKLKEAKESPDYWEYTCDILRGELDAVKAELEALRENIEREAKIYDLNSDAEYFGPSIAKRLRFLIAPSKALDKSQTPSGTEGNTT